MSKMSFARQERIRELEQYLQEVQSSTRTLFRSFSPLHDSLRMRFGWYYRWHTYTYSSATHWILLVAYLLSMLVGGFVMFAAILISPNEVGAAEVVWDGGGTEINCPGAANDWSCPYNWSSDTVPSNTETVVFNSTSTKNSVIDSGFTGIITGLVISSNYSGTIDQSRSLTVSSYIRQEAGTYNLGANTLTTGSYSISGGTFNGDTGTGQFDGDFNQAGGVFTAPTTWSVASIFHRTGVLLITTIVRQLYMLITPTVLQRVAQPSIT